MAGSPTFTEEGAGPYNIQVQQFDGFGPMYDDSWDQKTRAGPCLDRCLAFALANSQFNFAGRIAVVAGGSISIGSAGHSLRP